MIGHVGLHCWVVNIVFYVVCWFAGLLRINKYSKARYQALDPDIKEKFIFTCMYMLLATKRIW